MLSVTFVLGMLFGNFLVSLDRKSSGQQKLDELFAAISENYVDTINTDSLVELAIPALLNNLDPHSVYIPASSLQEANQELEGSFAGIGIQFQIYNDTVNVVEVIAGGPSEKAGIMGGDRIVTVDGKDFTGKGMNEDAVRTSLRGPKGTKVTLGIQRQGSAKPLKFVVTRGDIPLTSVESAYKLDETTGYLKVSRFARNTYDEFFQGLSKLASDGAKDFVIDLRGNTGGFMETAILMVNEFLPAGKIIVATKGRNHSEDQIVLSDGTGAFTDSRVVVLIDEMSASSSEIFSGALQDHDRGLILGRRSFGKGLVQRQMALSDGSELRLTVQRYYTPSGRCIQKEYKAGHNDDYELEVFERYRNGEVMNEDSVKLNKDLIYHTSNGRTVYGGGGIMPDLFVPNDTAGITNYYVNVANKGLLQKFAYEYADLNRESLRDVKTVAQLMKKLPSNDVLLSSFVYFATNNGVPARWYYINLSRSLIVTQLKALIARDVIGIPAYYEVMNTIDNTLARAVKELKNGNADFPLKKTSKSK